MNETDASGRSYMAEFSRGDQETADVCQSALELLAAIDRARSDEWRLHRILRDYVQISEADLRLDAGAERTPT